MDKMSHLIPQRFKVIVIVFPHCVRQFSGIFQNSITTTHRAVVLSVYRLAFVVSKSEPSQSVKNLCARQEVGGVENVSKLPKMCSGAVTPSESKSLRM